jgi:hypothetical protein
MQGFVSLILNLFLPFFREPLELKVPPELVVQLVPPASQVLMVNPVQPVPPESLVKTELMV